MSFVLFRARIIPCCLSMRHEMEVYLECRPSLFFCSCVYPLVPCSQHKSTISQTPRKMSCSINHNSKQRTRRPLSEISNTNKRVPTASSISLLGMLHISTSAYVGTSFLFQRQNHSCTSINALPPQEEIRSAFVRTGAPCQLTELSICHCSNVNSRSAEHSFNSTSQPAALLQAEIHLLSLCLQQASRTAASCLLLVTFPLLVLLFAFSLFTLLTRNTLHLIME